MSTDPKLRQDPLYLMAIAAELASAAEVFRREAVDSIKRAEEADARADEYESAANILRTHSKGA